MKIIVAGGRTFSDEKFMAEKLKEYSTKIR